MLFWMHLSMQCFLSYLYHIQLTSLIYNSIFNRTNRHLCTSKLRTKHLEQENIQIKNNCVDRSFLRLDCKKLAADQAMTYVKLLEEKLANLKKKPTKSFIQNLSMAKHNLELANKCSRIERYKLCHCQ